MFKKKKRKEKKSAPDRGHSKCKDPEALLIGRAGQLGRVSLGQKTGREAVKEGWSLRVQTPKDIGCDPG